MLQLITIDKNMRLQKWRSISIRYLWSIILLSNIFPLRKIVYLYFINLYAKFRGSNRVFSGEHKLDKYPSI